MNKASVLLKLPIKEREELLACAAILAEQEYRNNKSLTDFEAFGEKDLYDETPGDIDSSETVSL